MQILHGSLSRFTAIIIKCHDYRRCYARYFVQAGWSILNMTVKAIFLFVWKHPLRHYPRFSIFSFRTKLNQRNAYALTFLCVWIVPSLCFLIKNNWNHPTRTYGRFSILKIPSISLCPSSNECCLSSWNLTSIKSLEK